MHTPEMFKQASTWLPPAGGQWQDYHPVSSVSSKQRTVEMFYLMTHNTYLWNAI